jgi:lipopolysaccharide transport system permease protein
VAKDRGTIAGGRSSATTTTRKAKKARRRSRATNGAPPARTETPEALSPSSDVVAPPPARGAEVGSHLHPRHHPTRAIEPLGTSLRQYFGDLWRHRVAFGYFMKRFMQKRIGRTYFGYLWFVLPYVIPLFIGALVFGGILGVGIPGVPYLLYFAITLSAWLVFSQTAYLSTRSLELTRSEVRRLYVPRMIPLAAGVTLPAIALTFYMVMTLAITAFYLIERGEFYLDIRPATLLVPVALVMLVVFAWSCALWFSTLAPRARDVRRLTGYVIGIWSFLTPVMYPISEIPSGYRFLASLNPVTAPLELVKDGWLNAGHVTGLGVAMYFAWLAFSIIGGLIIFVPKERRDAAFY